MSNLPVTSEMETTSGVSKRCWWICDLSLGSRFMPTDALTLMPNKECSISIVNFFINFFLTSRLILLYNTDELIPSFFDKVGTEIFASLVNSKISFKSNSSNLNNDRKMKHLVINVHLIMLILINTRKSWKYSKINEFTDIRL